MKHMQYSFAEAMNIVGNGGIVNREDHPQDWYIMLCEENDMLSRYVDNGDGMLVFEEEYAPDLEDIKAQDWYLREKPQPKDTRTEDEIQFDEEMLSIMDSLDVMGELVVDQKRSKFYFALQDALKKLEQEPKNEKKVLPPYFNDGEINAPIFEAEFTEEGLKQLEEDLKRLVELLSEERPPLRDMEFIKR